MKKNFKDMSSASISMPNFAINKQEPAPSAMILVVDDNAWNRETLVKLLMERGIQVVSAENGMKALELIGNNNFSLVLLDAKMPKFNGVEVLKKARISFTPL